MGDREGRSPLGADFFLATASAERLSQRRAAVASRDEEGCASAWGDRLTRSKLVWVACPGRLNGSEALLSSTSAACHARCRIGLIRSLEQQFLFF